MTEQRRKPINELTLLDRFFFSQAMEDLMVNQTMLEIILGEEIHLLETPETEKEFRSMPENRSVRIDVFSMDDKDNVYDTEVQKRNTGNIPKRTRFYQALIDCNLLRPGTFDFNQMKNVFVIFIAPFDLWGGGKYRYTFRMHCEEDPGLILEDGAVRIFLNTKGTVRDGVSDELIELLDYFESATGEKVPRIQSDKLKEMHKRIQKIRWSEEVGVRYMQEWEERAMEQQEARLEGCTEGRTEGRTEGNLHMLLLLVNKKMKKGMTVEEIATLLEEPKERIADLVEIITLYPEKQNEELVELLTIRN